MISGKRSRFVGNSTSYSPRFQRDGIIVMAGLFLAVVSGMLIVFLAGHYRGGVLEAFRLAGFVLLLWMIGSWIAGRLAGDIQEKRFLRRLFLVAYTARLVIALLFLYLMPVLVKNHPYLSYGFFGDDGMAYDRIAFRIASGWHAGAGFDLLQIAIPGARGYILLNAVLYFIFGHQVLVVRFFESFLGALVPVFTYEIARRLLPSRWARFAALLTAFYPEQLLYSVVQLKEISVTFAMVTFLWASFRWKEKPSIWGGLWMVISLIYVLFTRFYYAFPLLAASAVVLRYMPDYMPGRPTLQPRRLVSRIAIIGALFLVSEYILNQFFDITLFNPFSSPRIEYFLLSQQTVSDESFYRIFSGAAGIVRLALIPAVIVYTFLNPFLLWPLISPDPVFTLLAPAIVLWYILLPFLLFSLLSRFRSPGWYPLLALITVALLLLALSGGGAAATGRLKVSLQPFFFLFATDGLRRFASGDSRLRIMLLLYSGMLMAIVMLYLFVRAREVSYGAVITLAMTGAIVFIHRLLQSRLGDLGLPWRKS